MISMAKTEDIIIAPKCEPKKELLNNVKEAGFEAVELYLCDEMLNRLDEIIRLCKNIHLHYAVHAPGDGYQPDKLAELVKAIAAEAVVFHDIYWDDEWTNIIDIFKNIDTKLYVENTYSVHQPVKFMRRYRLGRCLDLEHLQMECAGVYEEELLRVAKEASYIHLTGYIYGSQLWHTHIHHSPEHNLGILSLLRKAGYRGLVISEAKRSLQTYAEFKGLSKLHQRWNGR